jgi:Family of unknown function (DUF6228)
MNMNAVLAEFWLGSRSGGPSLHLVAGGPDWPRYFWAELKETGLDCRARVSAWDPSGVNKFSKVFREMNEAWRGWEGEKVWKSTEGELQLRFSINAKGGISIDVHLRDPYRWNVTTHLGAESGDTLSALAKSAEAFQGALDGAA